MSFTSRTQFPSSAYISGQTPIEPELREWLQHLEQHAPPENLQKVQEYCKSVVENEQEKEKEIALALAKHHRPESGEHEPGMNAVDLISLNQTPTYTDPKPTVDWLEFKSHGSGVPLEDWRPRDKYIVEELAIASNMVPEILSDDDYDWHQLYDMTPGIPFHNTQGESDLREQITKFHFPSNHDLEVFKGITEEDIRRGEWITGFGFLGGDLVAELEWEECLELSHFKEYDQALDEEYFILNNQGWPALHNAERHEQQCALNALYNHQELDWVVKSSSESPANILDECGIHGVRCETVCTGRDFAVATTIYGAAYIPKFIMDHLGLELGDKFVSHLRIPFSPSGKLEKYPLRVEQVTSF